MTTGETLAKTAPRPRRTQAHHGAPLEPRPAKNADLRLGEVCPTCNMAKPLAGTCDNCD